MVSGGNLPALRTAMKPLPKWAAMAGPNRNPRDSRPAMESNSLGGHRQGLFKCFEQNLQALGVGEHWHEITEDDALGNPGTERTKDTRYSASCCPTFAQCVDGDVRLCHSARPFYAFAMRYADGATESNSLLRLGFVVVTGLVSGVFLGHDGRLDRNLTSLIVSRSLGVFVGQRVAVLVDLIIGHIGRAGVLTGDGVEAETQLGAFGVDDDLLILLVDFRRPCRSPGRW